MYQKTMVRFGLIVAVAILCLSSGCAYQKPVPVTIESLSPAVKSELVDAVKAEVKKQPQRHATNLEPAPFGSVKPIPTRDDPVSEAVSQMAQQLVNGLTYNRVRRFPIALLPFTTLRNSVPDALIGERLSESFIFPLQQRGYNLVDYRAVSLATSAKQPVSKSNLSALRQRYKIYFVLTGTYARHPDGIVVNARILDTTTRQVLAAAQTHIPDQRLEGLQPGYDPVKAIQNGYIIENGAGPVRSEK